MNQHLYTPRSTPPTPQPIAYPSPAPNARAASIYDTHPESHGRTIDPNEIINSAPQGFGPNDGYDDDDSLEYVDDDPSYYAGRGVDGGVYGMNGVDGMGRMAAPAGYPAMYQEPDEEPEVDLSRRRPVPTWRQRRRGTFGGGNGFGFLKRIPTLLGRRKKYTPAHGAALHEQRSFTHLGPPVPASIRSHYSELPPETDGQVHASESVHSHPSQQEDLQPSPSLRSHRSHLRAVNAEPPPPEILVSPTTNVSLTVPGDPTSPHPSVRQRPSPASSVPQIRIDEGSSPARTYRSSTIRSRAHSTRTSSKSSHAHSQQSHGSESTLGPANSMQHLMHHHTSAPASRTPSLYPPTQPYHEAAPDTALGQVARALDNVLSMPWHDHDQVAEVYMPDVSSSRAHARVRESGAAQKSPDAAEALALHGQSWYYPSEKQIQNRMRKRSRWGRRNLARGPSNASSNQYLLAPAYVYGDGYVAQLAPRSQLSMQSAMSPNMTTSPPGSYGMASPPHQVYNYSVPAAPVYYVNQQSNSTY